MGFSFYWKALSRDCERVRNHRSLLKTVSKRYPWIWRQFPQCKLECLKFPLFSRILFPSPPRLPCIRLFALANRRRIFSFHLELRRDSAVPSISASAAQIDRAGTPHPWRKNGARYLRVERSDLSPVHPLP